MGAIRDFLEADHVRLDALLTQATSDATRIDDVAFTEFRAGLLRHIAMEEKVLLAEARRLRNSEPLPAAAQLRLDHAAIAAILAARPNAELVGELRAILEVHNLVEEGEDGVYADCERLAGDGVAALLDQLRAVPPVRLAPYAPAARIAAEIGRALRSAHAVRKAR